MNGEQLLLRKRVDRVSRIINAFLRDDNYQFAPSSEKNAHVRDVYFSDDGSYTVYLEGIEYDSKLDGPYSTDVHKALGKRYAFVVIDGIPAIQFTPPSTMVKWGYLCFFVLWMVILIALSIYIAPRIAALATYFDEQSDPLENLRRAVIFVITNMLGIYR